MSDALAGQGAPKLTRRLLKLGEKPEVQWALPPSPRYPPQGARSRKAEGRLGHMEGTVRACTPGVCGVPREGEGLCAGSSSLLHPAKARGSWED